MTWPAHSSKMSCQDMLLQPSPLTQSCYVVFDQVTDNPGTSVQPSWLTEDVKSSLSVSLSVSLHASCGVCLPASSQLPVPALGTWFWSQCNSVTLGCNASFSFKKSLELASRDSLKTSEISLAMAMASTKSRQTLPAQQEVNMQRCNTKLHYLNQFSIYSQQAESAQNKINEMSKMSESDSQTDNLPETS